MKYLASSRSVWPSFAVASLLALALVLLGGRAEASHYALAEVPRLITPADAAKLQKAGVNTTEELFDKAAKAKDRKALAKSSGLSGATLLGLARRCDLLRIKGIGSEMVLLLEASGVKSSAELAKKDAAGLNAAVTKANQAKKISDKPPAEPQLQYWIEEAKKLPPVLESQ
jgi:predicted flap endonuclease-1-like 5' DNA nuclease